MSISHLKEGLFLKTILATILSLTISDARGWSVDETVYICEGGTGKTITAEGVSYRDENKIEWFSDEGCNTRLATGVSFTVGSDKVGKSIYVRKVGETEAKEIQVRQAQPFHLNHIEQSNGGVLCKNGMVSLSSRIAGLPDPQNVSYKWYKDNMLVGSDSIYDATDIGNYTFSVTSQGCEKTITTVIAPEKEKKITKASGADAICNGGHINIEVAGMDSYQWSGEGVSNPVGNKCQINKDGVVTIVGKSIEGGCTDTLKLNIRPKESLEVEIEGVTAFCPGMDSTRLIAVVKGIPDDELTFQWHDDFLNDLGESSSITIGDEGRYTVYVNSSGCNGSTDAYIRKIENVAPTKIDQNGTVFVCAGSTTNISGIEPSLTSYVWQDGEGNIISEEKKVTLRNEGEYHVTGYTQEGCVSDVVDFRVEVKENPGLFLPLLMPCKGDTVEIEAQFADTLNFRWTSPSSIASETSTKLEIHTSGTYAAQVRDLSTKCFTNSSIEIQFLDYPVITAPDTFILCQGYSTEIHVEETNGTQDSYQWRDESGRIIKTRDNSLIVSQAGQYTFRTENEHGCPSEKKIVVVSKERPSVALTQSQKYLCNEDENVVITAQSDNAKSYHWTRDNSTIANEAEISVNEPGTYRLFVTGQNNCVMDTSIIVASKSQAKVTYTIDTICEGSSGMIHLASDVECDYLWEDGLTLKDYTVSKENIYTVTATDKINHCSQKLHIQVDLRPKPTIEADKDLYTLCEGDSIIICDYNSGGSNTRGKAIYNPFHASKMFIGKKGEEITNTSSLTVKKGGEYHIVGTSTFGCTSDTLKLTFNEKRKPVITLDGSNSICLGDTGRIRSSVTGAEPFQYKWAGQEETPSLSVSKAGTYTLTVTDNNGCTNTASTTIDVDTVEAEIVGPDQFCTDSVITLTASGNAASYIWNGENTSKTSYKVGQEGPVKLKATSRHGCEITLTKEVRKRAIPVITTDSVSYFCENSSTELKAEMDSTPSRFIWGVSPDTPQQTLNVDQEGTYTVTGYDQWNCPSKPRDIRVEMTPTPQVEITGADFVCEEGEPIQLVASVQTNYDYNEWSTGERADTITVEKGGEFSVVSHVGLCQSEPASFKVEFIRKPNIRIEGKEQFCTDSTLSLTAQGDAEKYYWNDASENETQYTLTHSETVSLKGINSYGCQTVITQDFTQRAIPVIHLDSVTYYCENSSIEIQAIMDSTPSLFVWNGTEETSSASYTADHESTVKVMGYDAWGCPSKEVETQVRMTKIPQVTIQGKDYVCQNGEPTALTVQVEGVHDRIEWSTGETNDTIYSDKGGQYIAKAYIGVCGSSPDTFDVEYKKIPKVSIEEGESVEFCDSLSVTLHAQSPTATTYWWEPSGDSSAVIEVNTAGTFTVHVEDQFGCVNSESTQTIAIPGPQMKIIGDATLCELGTTVISLECPDCVQQIWNTGETSSEITIYQSGTYTAKGTDQRGCPNSATHILNITPAPDVTIEGRREITGDDSTTLVAVATGEEPFRYYWTPTKEMTSSILVTSDDIDQQGNYSVIVYDRNGCYNFTTTQITKHSVKLNGKLSFCEGDSSTLTAVGNGISSYRWSTGDTSNSITVSQAGLYSIITSHDIGLEDTIRFEVVVHPNPQVNISGDVAFCRGDSAYIHIQSNVTNNLWSTGSSQDSIIVREKGSYSVTSTSEFGCVSRDTIDIDVYELPDVSISGPDSILEGGRITLQGEGAITYQWNQPDTLAESIEIEDGGLYSVVGTDLHNCRNSASHDVRVIPVPHPLINDTINGHTIACVDDKVMLVASGASTYLWDTGETNDTIYAKESRIYTVIGCLNNGQCDSVHFSVELSPRPRMMSIEGDNRICRDSFALFTAHTYEDSLVSRFVWSTGENTPIIKANEPGTYTVRASSIYGCLSDSLSIVLSHYPTPEPIISGIAEICEGSATTLFAKGGRSYLWLDTDSQDDHITVNSEGKVSLRAWNEYGCAADTSTYVTMRGIPHIGITGNSEICEGDSSTLSVTGDSFSENHYLWNTGDTTPSIVTHTGGVFTVTLSNRSGCAATDTFRLVVYPTPAIQIEGPTIVCANDSILLTYRQTTDNTIVRHIWDNEGRDSAIYVSTAGIHTLQVIDEHACASNIAQHEVKTRTPNPITVTGDFNICNQQEDEAKISAHSQGAVFYAWLTLEGDTLTDGDATLVVTHAGTYRAIATDSFGCVLRKTATIKGHNAPDVSIKGAETPVCGPSFATLYIEPREDIRSILWSNGETGSQIILDTSGKHQVTITDTFGCRGTDKAELILNDIPGMRIEGDFGFCPGSSATINASGADKYLWSNGSASDQAEIREPGDYTVHATDRYGCIKELTFHIISYDIPDLSIVHSPAHISRINPEVKFIAFSNEDVSECAFSWSMGDGNNMEGKEFSYTFGLQQQRWFNVTLTATTTHGCVDNNLVTLGVDLEIPNTITPNGDGVNDIFMKGFDVEIFDRHGKRIFNGEDGWDGQLKDKSVVADTYYYVLTDITGEIYRGYLTVRK